IIEEERESHVLKPAFPPPNDFQLSAAWTGVASPSVEVLEGRYVRLETLDLTKHLTDLWDALVGPKADRSLWEYMKAGPFESIESFQDYLREWTGRADRIMYACLDPADRIAEGLIGMFDVVPAHGRLAVGHVIYGSSMQRSAKGTEAVYLLLREAFSLGYRRVEWDFNNRNERSKRAAVRFGFTFEALHPQHFVRTRKGQKLHENVDRAMYSMLDGEWPAIRKAFEEWLSPENQAETGQKAALGT
ncbi:hypothetical protein AAVH_21819, partial [Aphelenchoides avenae]